MERWKTHHPFFTNDQSSQRSIHQFSPSHVTSKTSRVISHVNVPRELNSSFQCPNSCIPSRKSGVIPRTRLDLESGKPRANQRIYAYFQGSSLSCEFVSSAGGVFFLGTALRSNCWHGFSSVVKSQDHSTIVRESPLRSP